MKTVMIQLTRPGGGTLPGGIILRRREDGECVVHDFEREPGKAAPVSFHVGSYFISSEKDNLAKAIAEFQRRVFNREMGYPTASRVGGSLIAEADVAWELEIEARLAAEVVDETEDMTT